MRCAGCGIRVRAVRLVMPPKNTWRAAVPPRPDGSVAAWLEPCEACRVVPGSMDSVRRWLEAGRRDLAGHCALHGAWAVADAGGDCAELEAAVSWLYRRMRDDELNAYLTGLQARIVRKLAREGIEVPPGAAPVWERRGSHLSRPHGRV